MHNKNHNIETCIIDGQINIVFKGVFLKSESAYLDDQLQATFDDGISEIILNMKDLEHITGQCMQVLHKALSELYITKKIVIICHNNSKVERLLLHLGFAQWFSFFDDEDQLVESADTQTDIENNVTDVDHDELTLFDDAA